MREFVPFGLGFVIGLAFAAAFMLIVEPAHADETCISVEQAQTLMKASGYEVLAVRKMPYSGKAIIYRVGKSVYAAPIDGECVSPVGSFIGPLIPETNV